LHLSFLLTPISGTSFIPVWGSFQLLACNICFLGRDVTGDLQARRDAGHHILMINIPVLSSVWGSIQLLPCNICSLVRDVTGDLQARRDVEHHILMINIPILSFSLSFNQALCLQQLFPG
jgi:hypothetical protein